jgi:hypothetical protein
VPAEALEVVPFVQRDDQVVELARLPNLAPLTRHQPGLRRRALHVHACLRQVEVGREGLDDVSVLIVFERERMWLVQPRNAVCVEELCEL